MRKKNFKGRCEKRSLPKFDDVCRTFDDVMFACADFLSQKEDIAKIRCNVLLDGTNFTTDFVCTKADGDICVFECVERKRLTKPMTAKLLDESREFWTKHGVVDWNIVIGKETSDED